MYGVYSRAITKGRNNPDPNIEDLICVRSNQWCIRTRDSIKCKKLYTGLDRRILTCYNNALYPGIAKLVSRLVWDQETVRSSRTTRTKSPLKSLISEGFSYSLSIAAQILRLSFSTYLFDKHRLDIVIFAESQYN